LITETLRNPDQIGAALFSDSALKVVFTTLYVDIKEPAAWACFQPTKKTQSFSGDPFAARPRWRLADRSRRDKIEFQFAVPNSGQNQSPYLAIWESRFGRVGKVFSQLRSSTAKIHFFRDFSGFFAPQEDASGEPLQNRFPSPWQKSEKSVHRNISDVNRADNTRCGPSLAQERAIMSAPANYGTGWR